MTFNICLFCVVEVNRISNGLTLMIKPLEITLILHIESLIFSQTLIFKSGWLSNPVCTEVIWKKNEFYVNLVSVL